MNKGRLLAAIITVATVTFVVIGTLWPNSTAIALAGGNSLLRPPLHRKKQSRTWHTTSGGRPGKKPIQVSRNKAEFTEPEFVHDLTGSYPSLRTYATLDNFELRPLHASSNEAQIQLRLHWSTVVGTFSGHPQLAGC